MAKRIIKKEKQPPMPTVEDWLRALGRADRRAFMVDGYTTADLERLFQLSRAEVSRRVRRLFHGGLVGCAPRGRASVGVDGITRWVPVYFLKAM